MKGFKWLWMSPIGMVLAMSAVALTPQGNDAGFTANVGEMIIASAYAKEDEGGKAGESEKGGESKKEGEGSSKVTICHNGNTITISKSGLNGHIPHHAGDYFGECVPGGGTPICVSAASLYAGESGEKGKADENSKAKKYDGVTTAPCTTVTGEPGVWVDSVSGTPSSGPASGPGSFREVHGQ